MRVGCHRPACDRCAADSEPGEVVRPRSKPAGKVLTVSHILGAPSSSHYLVADTLSPRLQVTGIPAGSSFPE